MVGRSRTARRAPSLPMPPSSRRISAPRPEAGRPRKEAVHDGDELLLLLSGALDVILDLPEGERTIPLTAGGACLVPRGVWHRLAMHQPSDLVFVTPPAGTLRRPVNTR